MTLPKRPKLAEHATPAEYNYALCKWHKARAEFAIAALERITSGVPAMIDGSFCEVHFDGEGNEIGIEHLDPVSIVQSMDGAAYQALSELKRNSEGYAS